MLAVIVLASLACLGHALNECPAGWTYHSSGGERLCYKDATDGFDFASANSASGVQLFEEGCRAHHPSATLIMPKTEEQSQTLQSFLNDGYVPLGLSSSNGVDFTWQDGTPLKDGDFNSWGLGHPSGCSGPCGVELDTTGGINWISKDYTGSGNFVDELGCQITLRPWSCLQDRLSASKDSLDHLAHQAVGCRQVLTCSSRDLDDNLDVVNGLTVNLRQSDLFSIAADVDLVLETDALVSIAFSEGTSPDNDASGKAVCNAESLGLFLPHAHTHAYTHHAHYGLHGMLAGHGVYGHMYGGGSPYFGHGHGVYGRFNHYGHVHAVKPPKTIAKQVSVTGGVKATFNIQKLEGFTSLTELAGRGVVVCPSDKVEEKDGAMRCLSDAIPICCSMGWALEADQQFLE